MQATFAVTEWTVDVGGGMEPFGTCNVDSAVLELIRRVGRRYGVRLFASDAECVAACSKDAAADVTACCKAAPVAAKCSTIASTVGFCGEGKVYDDTKAEASCAAPACSKDTAADVKACCKPTAKSDEPAEGADKELSRAGSVQAAICLPGVAALVATGLAAGAE